MTGIFWLAVCAWKGDYAESCDSVDRRINRGFGDAMKVVALKLAARMKLRFARSMRKRRRKDKFLPILLHWVMLM